MNQKTFLTLAILCVTITQSDAIERSPLLRASDGDKAHYFGVGLALSNDHALVGAPYAQGNSGAVYQFKNLGVCRT